MANLPESSNFDAGVYQLETTDPVIGGPSGVSNSPLKNLANRTRYLKDHVDAIETNFAPKASPALTGTPTAPTAPTGTNTTQLATTAFVRAAVAADAVPLSHVGSNGSAHGVATTATAGFMSPADKALVDSIQPGQVSFFAMGDAPTGWLRCNGAAISRTTYAALFAAIGTTFGTGNGSTTFNLPDLRGEFIRGWDNGRGIDSGRVLGQWQADAFKSHDHMIPAHDIYNTGSAFIINDNSGDAIAATDNVTSDNSTYHPNRYYTAASGGSETRPRNVALLACIKF